MTEIDIFGIEPHPAAEVFPMLPDEELDELAADIRDNGLIMPLLVGRVDGQTALVDGRNRREACRRAGITPNYTLLTDGEDLPARILSENVYRRHMIKSQRAMVVARVLETNHVSQRKAADSLRIKQPMLAKASIVLHHAPDLTASVIAGHISLENAYEEARIRKGRADTHESRFNALKEAAPDLAEMVVEERLTLEEAEAAERDRAERARHNKKLVGQALHSLAAHAYLLNPKYQDEVVQLITCESEFYTHYAAGPVDEFIEALAIFERRAGVLLGEIRKKVETDDAEKG